MIYDYVIIGAGAAGLYAASKLTAAEKTVLLLEARDRIGGRIYTIANTDFTHPIEGGAEFIHGEMPITLSLLADAKISFQEMQGEVYQVENGSMKESDLFDQDWHRIMDKLNQLKVDVTFEEFLQHYFPGNDHLHRNIKKFAEGYNAADSNKVSSFALREEWSAEDEPIQNRPIHGYGPLMEFLLHSSPKKFLQLRLNEEVTEIRWSDTVPQVITGKGTYAASKVLVTVPLGVLQAETIKFKPEIPTYVQASHQIGFGPVIKVVMEFNHAFWERHVVKKYPSFKFIFSDADVPTWWSELPSDGKTMTGWIGGPNVRALRGVNLRSLTLQSISYLLHSDPQEIERNLTAFYVHDWLNDPFSFGAYSYDTLESKNAKKILNESVAGKIYFAGEACYAGPHTGTVEAAFESAEHVIRQMLNA